MALTGSDLAKRTTVSSPTITDAEEITGVTSSEQMQLNRTFLSNVGKSIGTSQNTEKAAMGNMLSMAAESKFSLQETNKYMTDLKDTVVDFDVGAAASQGADAVKSGINTCVGAAKDCISSAKNATVGFAKSINPNSGFAGIKSLAAFLACPERSLLGDLDNAFSSIVNKGANLNPSNLLTSALQNLTKSILNQVPGANNLLGFFENLSAYFMTKGSDKGYALGLVNSLLGSHGQSSSYILDMAILNGVKDLLDPSKDSVYINNVSPNIPLPYELEKQQCSQLAKIIQQSQSSYRADNRFDDLDVNNSATVNISDPKVFRMVDAILGNAARSVDYEKELAVAKSNGYHGQTALNASFSTAIENMRLLTEMENQLNEVSGDPVRFEAVRINIIQNTAYLQALNNISTQRLYAFEEGIGNIQRRSNFYDLSNSFDSEKIV